MKIVIKEKKIEIDDILEDCSVEELQEELPERNPRYPFACLIKMRGFAIEAIGNVTVIN